MKNNQIKLLEGLVKTPSPSGFEQSIAEFIKKELLEYLPNRSIKVDDQYNVIATIKGTSSKTIMIDAHADQIGFIVSNIDKEGFISIQYIGGGDTTILSARNLIILTEKGKVNAVVNRKHSHLIVDEADEAIINLRDAMVDIGIRKRGKVAKVVKIGDPAIYSPTFIKLRESYYAGCGMDDKVGCFTLIEVIKQIAKSDKKPKTNLVFTFSVQEEIGGFKCRPLIRKHNPDLFVEVDVTFATDCGIDEDLERETGRCRLNKGPVIYRGVDLDVKVVKKYIQ